MKNLLKVLMILAIGIQFVIFDCNLAEARQDYYCGYDE